MLRVFEPGLASHVILRGNDRCRIVAAPADYRRLLADLAIEVRLHGVDVHSYVLMTNHIHLMVTGSSAESVPRAIQGLGRRYVPYFNLRNGRSGTLWEGRYRSSPIASERYLFTCRRYIELNPVRAGMVARPHDYRWSSHLYYAFGTRDELVTPHPGFDWNPGDAERVRAFRASFEEAIDESDLERIRSSANRCLALGDERDCRALELRLGVRVTPRPTGRRAKPHDETESCGQLEMMV